MIQIVNQRGQALGEMLVALMLLLTLVPAALLSAYVCFARLWIDYQLEQCLLCVAANENSLLCQRRLNQKVSNALAFGIWNSQMNQFNGQYSVRARFQILNKVSWRWHKKFNVEKIPKRVF